MQDRKSSNDKTQRGGNGQSKKSKRDDNPSGHNPQTSGGQTGTTSGSSKSDNA